MSDDLVKRLREAAVSTRTTERLICDEAADEIERLKAENVRLRKDLQVQANAVRMLDQCQNTEISHLRQTHQQAKTAAQTLDSEREANFLLTVENERLREALESLLDEQNGPPLIGSALSWQKAVDQARAALEQSEPKP